MRVGLKICSIQIYSLRLSVCFLLACLSFLVSSSIVRSDSPRRSLTILSTAYAQQSRQSQAIPSGWESYLDRPDILSLEVQVQDPNEDWSEMKEAHFSFIAELLEMYSENTHFYFLARDAEHLFDVARLVTEGPNEASRIKLLNVSSANMSDPNLKAYLNENGISDESLQSGKNVLFVDAGFAGTIPRVIGESFPENLRARLKAHLVVSSNPSHPSSRVFLFHLNPLVNELGTFLMHDSILDYEQMARFTDRSSRFIYSSGRYHPISSIREGEMGRFEERPDRTVSKEKSLSFMGYLKAEWQRVETKIRFEEERRQLRELKIRLSRGSTEDIASIKTKLIDLKGTSEGRLFESQVRDALELAKNASWLTPVTLEDLGLLFPDVTSARRVAWMNQELENIDSALVEQPEKPTLKCVDIFSEAS